MKRRDPADDPVFDFIMALGLPRFVALLAAACAAAFCVAHRIASLIWS